MSDDELASSIARSVEHRVGALSPRPDMEDLLARMGTRATRQRRSLLAGLAVVIVAAGFAGYLIGTANDDSGTGSVVAAQSDGLPSPEASSLALEPADAEAARSAITQAFHDALTGSSSDSTRAAAIQDGASLQALRREVLTYAQRYGYTSEQLAGTSVTVLGVAFIDE